LCAIGISFTNESVTYLVSDVDGSIISQDIREINRDDSKDELIQKVTQQIADLLIRHRDKRIVGIGISEPLFDPTAYQYGNSLVSNYLHFNDWIRFALKPKLEEAFGLLVESYSGVTMPVMAEHRYGVAKGVQNFICVELSNGIGSSICCNGMPIAGANGVAGELGHTVIEYGNRKNLCYCGKPGCVEVETAYPALVNAIMSGINQGVFSVLKPGEPITVESIRDALEAEDKMCMHFVKEAALRIGVVIANAVNLLNPELVVLHGFMLELGPYFLQCLEQSMKENVLTIASNFDLRISDSMETLLPLGAVAEIFSSYLHSNDYQWVYQLNKSETGGKL
jgi:predicted NBD/HSP70 family sugar kinase